MLSETNLENFCKEIAQISNDVIRVKYSCHKSIILFTLRIKENPIIQSGNLYLKMNANTIIMDCVKKYFHQKCTFNNDGVCFWINKD